MVTRSWAVVANPLTKLWYVDPVLRPPAAPKESTRRAAATLAATAPRDRRRMGAEAGWPAHQGVAASCSAGGGSSSLIALQRRTAVPRVQGRAAAGAGIWSWVMETPRDEQ